MVSFNTYYFPWGFVGYCILCIQTFVLDLYLIEQYALYQQCNKYRVGQFSLNNQINSKCEWNPFLNWNEIVVLKGKHSTGVHLCSCGSPNLPPAPDTQETCSTRTKLKNFSKLNSNCQLKPFEINLISSKTRDFLPFQPKPWVLDNVYFKNNMKNIVKF